MKKRNIIALILITLGIIISAVSWIPAWGLNTGYLAVLIGYPLILIGILTFIIGWIVEKVKKK